MTIESVLSGDAQWTVLEGDCRDVLSSLPDKCVTHVICDPPYTEHVQSRMMSASTTRGIIAKDVECTFDAMEDVSIVRELIRVSRRWTIAFCALEQLGDYQRAAPKQWIRSGIYHKQRAVPQFSGDRPGNSCEGIAIFHDANRKRWNGGGTHAFWEAMPSDRAETGHPTAKPLALMLQILGLFTDPGDVILDPFCGSGTTGVAAIRLGCRFIGIDMKGEGTKENYVALARARLAAEEQGLSLSAARAGQIPMFGATK
jgi:DNA modification methylase